MTTETQVEVAGTPAPVVTDDVKPTVPDTPEATAASGEVEKQEQVAERMFSQSEVDAIVLKRAQKEARKMLRETQAQQQEQARMVEPKREAFRDDEQFNEAHIEHLAEKRAQEKLEKRRLAEQAEMQAESFIEKAEKASERYADFNSVVSNPSLRINEAMAEFIAESDMGADVAYFLGKNQAKAAAIAGLSPIKAARELTRIEAELASKPKAQPSNAPEPIKPVGTRGKPSSSSTPSDDDDISTWMKKEQARVRSR